MRPHIQFLKAQYMQRVITLVESYKRDVIAVTKEEFARHIDEQLQKEFSYMMYGDIREKINKDLTYNDILDARAIIDMPSALDNLPDDSQLRCRSELI